MRRCDAAALARVQREGGGDGTWVELLHCNRSRVSAWLHGHVLSRSRAMSSSSESEDSEAEWEELYASQREARVRQPS